MSNSSSGEKLTLLDHLEACAIRAKNYASGLVAEVAQTAAGAIREINALKADQPDSVNITIPTTGWTYEEPEEGEEEETDFAQYPYYIDITITGLTADNHVSVTIAPSGLEAAASCGICPTNESKANVLRIRSVKVPAENIPAVCWVEYGKE